MKGVVDAALSSDLLWCDLFMPPCVKHLLPRKDYDHDDDSIMKTTFQRRAETVTVNVGPIVSEVLLFFFIPVANGDFAGSAFRNGRRSCLPAPCPDTSNINLWNILRNNIGKDLSKVSMPVELNEPLNTLQRMCEELEYSELLDKAAETEDPFERMVKRPSATWSSGQL